MNKENYNKIIFWINKKKRYIIGLTTIFLILFMLFYVDIQNLLLKIATIGFWGAFLFIITYTAAFILRSYKLKLIFKGLNNNINYLTSYFSIGVCFIINDLTPGRLGDLTKIFIIKNQENIKLSESVGGITIERVLDLILLFSISCFALIYLNFNNLNEGQAKNILGQNVQLFLLIGAIIIIGILIVLILLIFKTDLVLKIINSVSKKLANLLNLFFLNFKESIKKYKYNKKIFIYIVLLGVPTWIIDAFIVTIFFYILGYQLNVLLLILAIILSFFSKTVQITPGGWGISENIGALFIFSFIPKCPL